MSVVTTAGHVDHGKSTLLRTITGMEPDRWDEERRRGLTIDLGFVWTELTASGGTTRTVAFVDVPGHERFVPNMLAGAGAVHLALFVVAADDGWSAQSQEHLDILDLLDVGAAVCAVTKVDLAGEARSGEVAEDVSRRIAGTALDGAPVLLVDSVSGTGIAALSDALADRLEHAPGAPDHGRPRLWIDRSFTITGAGTVVTGTLADGELRADDDALVLPDRRPVRIRGLQALGDEVDLARPGSRVAVNLASVDADAVGRGYAVLASTHPATTTDTVEAWVTALSGSEIGQTGAWHLHVGSAEVLVEVHPLLGEPITDSGPGYVRLVLARPLPLIAGDRFVLRESGRDATLGGGRVLDPAPVDRPRGPDARLDRASALEAVRAAGDDPGEGAGGRARRLAALLDAWGGARLRDTALAAVGLPSDSPLPGDVRPVADHLVRTGSLEHWADAIEARTGQHHAAHPEARGAPRGELAVAAVDAGCPSDLAGALVDVLGEEGRLRRDGSAFALPAHAPARDEAKERRRARLIEALEADPFAPPDLQDAARAAAIGHEELNELVQSGEIVRCDGTAFTRRALQEAVDRLETLQARTGRFTTAQAREALGTTRKYAIPLLEHLDAVGVTEFDGQTRRLRDT